MTRAKEERFSLCRLHIQAAEEKLLALNAHYTSGLMLCPSYVSRARLPLHVHRACWVWSLHFLKKENQWEPSKSAPASSATKPSLDYRDWSRNALKVQNLQIFKSLPFHLPFPPFPLQRQNSVTQLHPIWELAV